MSDPQVDPALVQAIAKRFINRKDVYAEQQDDGSYRPVRAPWSKQVLEDHLSGRRTLGHYLLGTDDTVKLFALDIDLKPKGFWLENADLSQVEDAASLPYSETVLRHEASPREDFLNWRHPSRRFHKEQMRFIADLLASTGVRLLPGVTMASAFSGSKGVHVYGLFPSPVPAADAQEAARAVLEEVGIFAPARGNAFWENTVTEDGVDFTNFTVELFPKNTHLEDGGLGNLMRLPLGRNLKATRNPCFFLDQGSTSTGLVPHADPVGAITHGTVPR
jgi:hypothetical protein